ncbi:MAG TPA: SBBP repeat-containing protein [Nostocaceae cyanobacterium]|nr:SBBP repeat-containing protein [Nostocaceae cyanobacterium]
MNEDLSLNVSLLTPASDLVTGVDGIDFDIIFGRAGNDVFYSYDAIADANAKINIDVLFGDLFDNSPAEFEVVLNITTGNTFAILEANIPSVGKDRFVLGDEFQPYYTSFNPLSLLSTNILGLNEFAVIYDFDPTQDQIQLNGKKKDYTLLKVDGLAIPGVSGLFSGYALFSLQTGLPDLVSLIVQKPEVELNLKGDYFQFVGNKPKNKPAQKKIGQFGTNGIDISYGVATDSQGHLYIAGFTTGSLYGLNQGSNDVWVAKYDRNGNQVLALQLGSGASDLLYNIVTDQHGNFYLAGSTDGSFVGNKQSSNGTDAWVAKYDSNGNKLWGRQIGETLTGGFSTSGFGLRVDDHGNVYLSGLTIKDNPEPRFLDFDVEDDSWLIKFDSEGNQQWYTQIKDPQAPFPLNQTPFFDENYDLAIDQKGNSYLSGWTQGLVKESDPSRELLKYDAWLSKVDANGQIQWTQQFGSIDQGLDFAWSVATDSQSNIYVSGWTTGTIGTQSFGSYDVWLTKFTPEGTQVWAKQIGTNGDDGAFLADLVIDSQDNIFISGYTNADLGNGDADKSYNAWVGRFDTDGNNKWIQKIGIKDKADYATRLAVNNTGQVIVTGFTEGFLGNGNNFSSQGAAVDAWVAQLAVSDGKLQNFVGNTGNLLNISNPGAIPTVDISGKLVTANSLPSGNNRIQTTAGSDTGISLIDYGQIADHLASVFDPRQQNSVPTMLGKNLLESGTFNRTTKVDYKGTDRNDIYFGGSADDKLEGGKGDDVLYGFGGNDTIKGNEGDDILYGGDGNDTIEGGDGEDVIYGGGGIDLLQGGNDNDLFVIEQATEAEFDIFAGDRHNLLTNPYGDTIVNESYTDVVFNQFRDSWDIETFNGNGYGILGNAHKNILDFRKTTLLNVAFVDGGAGDDDIKGSQNDDNLRGGAGNDKIEGQEGNDTLNGDAGNDELKGGSGNDFLLGGSGNDKLFGEAGNDTLTGGSGNDELDGGDGLDILMGVNPDAALAGWGEIDKLKGGNQADLFVLGDSNQAYYVGQDNLDYGLINDFKLDQLDKIQLSGIASNYSLGVDVPGLPKGTGIFLENDLIGIVQDVKGLSLSNSDVFVFVG